MGTLDRGRCDVGNGNGGELRELPGRGALMLPRGPAMQTAGGWLDDARGVALAAVADALGLTVAGDGRSFSPCPLCGEVTRGRDRRGRCSIAPGGGWHCFSNGSDGCGAKGDALQLVAMVLTGRAWAKGDADTGGQVRAWYAGNGWCDPDTGADRGGQPRTPARPRPVQHLAIAPKPRPPIAEVSALWGRCVPVTADPDVAAWLANRPDGPIDPAAVAGLDLVRALPAELRDLPRWAWYGGESWAASGHRLIVRAYEADADNSGMLRWASLHARNVRPGCAAGDKAAWPAGCNASGLVLATGLDPAAHGLPLVELAEGVPDWLRLAVEVAALPAGERSATWGYVSGSAKAEIAELVPLGWTVAMQWHADDKNGTGLKYAKLWRELLAPRGCAFRWHGKANHAATSTIAPPDNSAALWTASAIAAMRDAVQGGELATIWALAAGRCGGLDHVPATVANVHRQRLAELNAAGRADYREQLQGFVDVPELAQGGDYGR